MNEALQVKGGIVLAAGFGTRLKPLSDLLPKPLVPVANRPLIHYSLALLARAGARDVVINLHHHGEAIASALGTGAGLGVHITYSPEEIILGTGAGWCEPANFSRMAPSLC